jgi:hypothetical protein
MKDLVIQPSCQIIVIAGPLNQEDPASRHKSWGQYEIIAEVKLTFQTCCNVSTFCINVTNQFLEYFDLVNPPKMAAILGEFGV